VITDEQAFLDAIRASPGDPVPRLLYADWLQARGDPRGEFVRLQVELGGLSPLDAEYPPLKARERELRPFCPAYWLGVLDQPPWGLTDPELADVREAWVCPAFGQRIADGLCWECCMAGHGGPASTTEWLRGWIAGSGRFGSLADFHRVCARCEHCAWRGEDPAPATPS
jgi:uncharacterized protein (TIGR02996 family)